MSKDMRLKKTLLHRPNFKSVKDFLREFNISYKDVVIENFGDVLSYSTYFSDNPIEFNKTYKFEIGTGYIKFNFQTSNPVCIVYYYNHTTKDYYNNKVIFFKHREDYDKFYSHILDKINKQVHCRYL